MAILAVRIGFRRLELMAGVKHARWVCAIVLGAARTSDAGTKMQDRFLEVVKGRSHPTAEAVVVKIRNSMQR